MIKTIIWGDPWKDGHGYSEVCNVEFNGYTWTEILELYDKDAEACGFSLFENVFKGYGDDELPIDYITPFLDRLPYIREEIIFGATPGYSSLIEEGYDIVDLFIWQVNRAADGEVIWRYFEQPVFLSMGYGVFNDY